MILMGGLHQKRRETVVGPLTHLGIQQVYFSKASIGIDGFHPESGFTGCDMMCSAVLAKGVENIILTDASKFGQPPSTAVHRHHQPGDHRLPLKRCTTWLVEGTGHRGR
ncbi:hypothetical protein KB20921_20770 [Edwardsiella ictaluri]|nr:hypothetical protein KH20906_20530 [Edwardsiella ictaluri]BEI02816.1 hypothetical protein KB20921_20770 [Edwardsiella ictaluri]BEI06278.1 hypothetical protein KH201010_20640 [Edwardsiella ictaluri]BEI09738.1 hypothetical protein STU22726_20690 [Edwardsiella ictaluri]BEI13218.1 hypothetical protein STU22816_20710 [Edwardsiella ictaluri]